MALKAQGYFNCLKSYLNTNHYGGPQASAGEVVLKEKVLDKAAASPLSTR